MLEKRLSKNENTYRIPLLNTFVIALLEKLLEKKKY